MDVAGASLATTKSRLLDAAERLFAESGIAGASVRSITAEAGANLAAVHYHFGSKDALVQAVFDRRVRPLNDARLWRLTALEQRAERGGPSLEEIVEAFVGPALELAKEADASRRTVKLLGRVFMEPAGPVAGLLTRQFGGVRDRFLAALGRALPHLSEHELAWRVHFLLGALSHAMASPGALSIVSAGRADPDDAGEATRQLVRFAAAGLRAPSAGKGHTGMAP